MIGAPAHAHAHAHARPLLAITSSLRVIADGLNRDRLPAAQGAQWYAATVRHVLLRTS
jgi:hypothetical protein